MQEILTEWLNVAAADQKKAVAIINRFPSYFVFVLCDEWAKNADKYSRLRNNTPFTDAAVMEEDWERYRAWLARQIQESIFDEAFSLEQIYVPLRAYYMKQDAKDEFSRQYYGEKNKEKRMTVELQQNLREWLSKDDREDDTRIICGGPGSGKSSFAKMFAAEICEEDNVLFIPLHQLDLSCGLKEVVGEFLESNRIFNKSPISKEGRLLIIFDGLDEIMQQGKASLDAAHGFVSQVQQLLRDHNYTGVHLKIIITGRDLPVQTIEVNYKSAGQILHVLPYYISEEAAKNYLDDDDNLLAEDQRKLWWQKYGRLTGKDYDDLPEELHKRTFDEITTQPLLNYLLALSLNRGKLQFSDDTNLNELYADLIDAVYERGWQSGGRTHRTLKGISRSDYEMILEEIAVSAWQGAGRTTTLEDIMVRCLEDRLEGAFDEFQDQAQDGVLNLLTAFYFRKSGIQDGKKTFEFTHKSFGEYLAARKIVRQLEETNQALKLQKEKRYGWTNEIALVNWIKLCSKVAMDESIFDFLCNEVRCLDKDLVNEWQEMLCELISYMLRCGMPFEQFKESFFEKTRQTRNSEEALLAALSACSRKTNKLSNIDWLEEVSAGEWISKLCGQRKSSFCLPLSCLNYLNLNGCLLLCRDFIFANLSGANLSGADLSEANLSKADLSGTHLDDANFNGANLSEAKFIKSQLKSVKLSERQLKEVIIY